MLLNLKHTLLFTQMFLNTPYFSVANSHFFKIIRILRNNITDMCTFITLFRWQNKDIAVMPSKRDSTEIFRVKAVSSIRLHIHTVNKRFHQTTSHLLLDDDSGQRIRREGGVYTQRYSRIAWQDKETQLLNVIVCLFHRLSSSMHSILWAYTCLFCLVMYIGVPFQKYYGIPFEKCN